MILIYHTWYHCQRHTRPLGKTQWMCWISSWEDSRIIQTAALWINRHFSFIYTVLHTSTHRHKYLQRVVPPRVAETKKWVPYFLIRFSVICWRVGRRPKSLMLRKNSGARGRGEPRKFLLSTARLFTFQRPNSLKSKFIFYSEIHNLGEVFHLSSSLGSLAGVTRFLTALLTYNTMSRVLSRKSNIYPFI